MEWELGRCDDKYFLFLIKDKEVLNIDISRKEAKSIEEKFNIEAIEYPF
ncbi:MULTISPECIES: hypothetical protein [Clostridium]|nr:MULTISPECIES: hypothetical protein [Clostridium]MBZ5746308.1 hypothetical protein [Clostridium butyricum]MDI9210049.1 hypothetical protein [Clostridium butyricum]MDU3581121.1 hypothetical protein [Clostridium butyricum]MDU3594683.1 hypothetical protein [Clostridium butyricum]BBK77721.1 hypothetical protein Cbu04g_27290 [Clostridium butyricum]